MAREMIKRGAPNRARNRRILVQGSMRSDLFQNLAQMHVAQDNDVAHTHARAIRSTARQGHFTKVKLAQRAFPAYPLRAIGV